MTTFTKKVVITADHRMIIEIPRDYPAGETTVTVILEDLPANKENRLAEIYGKGKGLVWMADDFDEPLDDFAEYMP